MPKFQKGGRKYHKKQHRQQKYGPKMDKSTFRPIRPYGIKADPFPTRLHTRCKYAGSFTLTANATPRVCGTPESFRINSIYDPYFTGVGTTVIGWAELSELYGSYIVNGAKIEVNFSNPSADGMVGIASLNQTSLITADTDSNNYMKSLVYTSDINNTGSQKKTMNFYVKPWALNGLSKVEWLANKSTHSSVMNNNPTQPLFFYAGCSGAVGSSTIHCSIRIIYYVEFFNRKQLDATGF